MRTQFPHTPSQMNVFFFCNLEIIWFSFRNFRFKLKFQSSDCFIKRLVREISVYFCVSISFLSICLFFLFFLSSFYRFSDLSDFPFPSISACPSLASSPVVARRDSILKHSGSVKNTDRRVSINQPIVIEYLSEKRQTPQSQPSSAANGNSSKSNARPASLILSKGERPIFKLIRTPSFDQEQDEATLMNTTNFAAEPTTQRGVHQSNSHHLVPDDDADESAPLVQSVDKTSSHS